MLPCTHAKLSILDVSWSPAPYRNLAHVCPKAAAELDGAYYAVLEHALCCGWAAPAVPPPHAWFPAFAAAHPGTLRSLQTLQCCKKFCVLRRPGHSMLPVIALTVKACAASCTCSTVSK